MTALVRLLILPFKLIVATFEATFGAARRIARLLGVRGTLGLLAGLALGLAFAPGPGRDLRARVKGLLAPPDEAEIT